MRSFLLLQAFNKSCRQSSKKLAGQELLCVIYSMKQTVVRVEGPPACFSILFLFSPCFREQNMRHSHVIMRHKELPLTQSALLDGFDYAIMHISLSIEHSSRER